MPQTGKESVEDQVSLFTRDWYNYLVHELADWWEFICRTSSCISE